jgi:hypothetical protein
VLVEQAQHDVLLSLLDETDEQRVGEGGEADLVPLAEQPAGVLVGGELLGGVDL